MNLFRHAPGGPDAVACGDAFDLYGIYVKTTLDAPSDLSIIRPTSGADETENSLKLNELTE
ncbi:hypothetical protein, partial [Pseudomonas putida]